MRLPQSSEAASLVVRLFHSFEATASDVRLPHQLLGKLTNCEAARVTHQVWVRLTSFLLFNELYIALLVSNPDGSSLYF